MRCHRPHDAFNLFTKHLSGSGAGRGKFSLPEPPRTFQEPFEQRFMGKFEPYKKHVHLLSRRKGLQETDAYLEQCARSRAQVLLPRGALRYQTPLRLPSDDCAVGATRGGLPGIVTLFSCGLPGVAPCGRGFHRMERRS